MIEAINLTRRFDALTAVDHVSFSVAKGEIGVPEIKAALAFIKSIGSVAAAKKVLDVAQEIRAIV